MNFNKFIEGEKIYLREVKSEDANEEYYNWMNDPEIVQFLETRFIPQSISNIKKFIENKDGNLNEILFAICIKENNKHIGNIKLGPINWIHRKGDISLVIGDKNYWGKGIATEAIGLVVEFAFYNINLNKVNAGYYFSNIGSGKAFEKCGFRIEGNFEQEVFYKGKYINTIRVGLTKNNYESNKK